MIRIKDILKDILTEHKEKSLLYRRNLLKEYLQIFVLEYIYTSDEYKDLVFYGGSCLSQIYGLERLSEDLDFVDIGKKIDIDLLAKDLGKYFFNKTDLKPEVKVQNFRIYLKFPVLKETGLAKTGESDLLFLKVEIFTGFDFCSSYELVIKPVFKLNKSLLVKTFDLPTLMSTKIRAVLFRKWEKTSKTGETIISVKGRDYYDLMWYLEKGIKPNLLCLEVENIQDLKKQLSENIEKADSRSIQLDLENFISDIDFVKNLSKNIKKILLAGIEKL